MAGTDRFITLNGLKLHYVEHGAAGQPAFVCLHGFGLHGHAWDTFAAQISDRYHVIAPSARGHGDSDRSEAYEGMAYVADVASLIEATGSAPAVVCGHSMGGSVGIGVAALHPDKVAKLIIVDAGPEGDPAGSERIATAVRNARMVFDMIEEAMDARRVAYQGIGEEELRRIVKNDLVRTEDGKLRRKADPSLFQNYGAADAEQAKQMKNIMWTACGMIKCPTLIVRGRSTDVLSRDVAERMVETISDSRLVEIDAGHMAQLEDPRGFYEAVKEFIDS